MPEFLYYCDDPVLSLQSDGFGGFVWLKSCGMTEGSSGGPWLDPGGLLVSTVSAGDGKGTIIGPYLGSTARALYNAVQGNGPPPSSSTPPPPAKKAKVSCVVPHVIGQRIARATTAIRRAHCKRGSIHRRHAHKPRNHVISQTPKAGRRLAKGSPVNLVVSLGVKT
jgi:hypothetical protein